MPWRQWRNRDQTGRRLRLRFRFRCSCRLGVTLRLRLIELESFGELPGPDRAVHLPRWRGEPARRCSGSRLRRRRHHERIGGVIGGRGGSMILPSSTLRRNLFQQRGRPCLHLVQFARSQVVERCGLADRSVLVRHFPPNSLGPPPGSRHRHRRHHQRKTRRGDGEDDPARPHITRIRLRRAADR